MTALMAVDSREGKNGVIYCAYIRSYGRRDHCAFVDGGRDPLYRGARRSTRDAAEREARRMLAAYLAAVLA
jgi:hypothetical protein